MLSVAQLISQVRRDTNNLSSAIIVSQSEGIQDIDFINALNRAQERLQAKIIGVNIQAFTKEKLLNVVSGQIEYSLPVDTFFKNKVACLEYSQDGNVQNFYQLSPKTLKERNNLASLYIEGYILRDGKIVLDPAPQSSVTGGLRLNYVYRLPSLDVPRAIVSSVSLSGNGILSLFVETAGSVPLSGDNLTALQGTNYISVVDRYGTIKMNKIPVESIDSGTGEIFIMPGFAFEDGQTIDIGDNIVTGFNASSFSQLPDDCERFLQVFANRYIFRRDSSDDIMATDQELKELEDDIISNWTDLNEDVEYVAVLDDGMFY